MLHHQVSNQPQLENYLEISDQSNIAAFECLLATLSVAGRRF